MKLRYDDRERFYLLGVVHGLISECGNPDFPGLYARVQDPDIFRFVTEQLLG